MQIKESNPLGVLEESTLLKFEKKIKVRLPEQYRNFLLEFNGGRPEPDHIKLPTGGGTILSYFSSLVPESNDEPDEYTINFLFSELKKRIPKDMLPFLDDEGGNVFLIKFKGKSTGSIYFWDHELEGSRKATIFLAEDFNSFLNSIDEYIPDDESIVDKIVRTQDVNELAKLLNEGFNLENENEYNRTIIELAAMYGKYDLFVWLVKKGALLRESLRYAIMNKNSQIVEYINGLNKNN